MLPWLLQLLPLLWANASPSRNIPLRFKQWHTSAHRIHLLGGGGAKKTQISSTLWALWLGKDFMDYGCKYWCCHRCDINPPTPKFFLWHSPNFWSISWYFTCRHQIAWRLQMVILTKSTSAQAAMSEYKNVHRLPEVFFHRFIHLLGKIRRHMFCIRTTINCSAILNVHFSIQQS